MREKFKYGSSVVLFSITITIFSLLTQQTFSKNDSPPLNDFEYQTFLNYRQKLIELSRKNYDSLIIASRDVLKWSNNRDYIRGKFEANIHIAFAHKNQGKIDSAFVYANTAHKMAELFKDPSWLASTHLLLGTCYNEKEDFNNAIYHYIECEKIARKNNIGKLLVDVLNSKGITYRLMKEYDTALKLFNSIFEDLTDSITTIDKFSINNNIANVYFDMESYSKALKYFSTAKKYAIKDNDSISITLTNLNLGNTFFKQGKLSLAEKYIQDAIDFSQKTGEQNKLEMAYRTLGNIHYFKSEHTLAEKNFMNAIAILKKSPNHRATYANHYNLSLNYQALYKQTRDNTYLKKQIKSLYMAITAKDSMYQLEKSKQLHELETKYETAKKNNLISLLEKESEIQKSRQLFMIIGILLLVGILIIMIVSIRYIRKTNFQLLIKNKEINRQNKKIETQNNQLETAIKTQNKLFSIIAHDLRSPLASISNINTLIRNSINNHEYNEASVFFERLELRNKQILQLTDNLLSWASSQTGKINYMPRNCVLKDLLKESFFVFDDVVKQKNIKMDFNMSGSINVFVDDITIKTVFRNLLNNAIKFTHNNGKITISCYTEEDMAIVKFSDTGIGIPQNIQDIIFDVNEKKQSVGTNGEKSSGLGLVISKEFVEKNNGKIWFESIENKGTSFYVSLPIYISKSTVIYEI